MAQTRDALQELTHHFCHIYGCANRAVSLVVPAYYAKLPASRAQFCVHTHGRPQRIEESTSTSPWIDSFEEVTADTTAAADNSVYFSLAQIKPALKRIMYYI